MNETIKKLGYVKMGQDVLSYQIGSTDMFSNTLSADRNADDAPVHLVPISIQQYKVYPFGVNNLEPNEAKDMIGHNKLLPQLIEKQVSMLYGNGPMLFIQQLDEDGLPKRKYLQDKDISEWLDNWKENGCADSFRDYIKKCISSFYYASGIFTKWRFTAGANMNLSRPVAGLEHVSVLRARLATVKDISGRTDFEDSDFEKVLIGPWDNCVVNEFKAYPRMDYTNPTKYPTAISYSKNPTHGEEVYSFNSFYRGIRHWIKASNLTPRYINDYLTNAMSARMHVIIPDAWLESQKKRIEELCETNAERRKDDPNAALLSIKFSDTEIIEIGTEYNSTFLDQYVAFELKKLTNYLSGQGNNQGKIFSSYSFTDADGNKQEWEIKEIPQKYKEYMEALITYDKRADENMLASKGMDASISNVSKDGIISNSGSNAYYNYMIYLASLTIPEEIVCQDANLALKLNFPEKYSQGIRIGFYRPTIAKQQDITPSQRMGNQEETS